MLLEIIKKLPIQLLNWFLKTFFTDWYYCQAWKWGDAELSARKKLLENLKKTKNIHLYSDITSKARKIIFFLFNKTYSGSYLEESISKSLSVLDFKQIYTILFGLFLARLNINGLKYSEEEVYALFPDEENLFEKLVIEIKEQCNDEKDQAIVAWSYISNIIGDNKIFEDGIWRGSFVLFTEKASKVLHDRWV